LTVSRDLVGEVPPQAAATTVHPGPSRQKDLAWPAASSAPPDDVLGHGSKRPEDDSAGDDCGKRNPDDTEGHMPFRHLDAEAVDEGQDDDVEGHRRRVGGG
jgi:hypothetical protein